MSRKRKYNGDSHPQFTHYIDSDDENFPAFGAAAEEAGMLPIAPSSKIQNAAHRGHDAGSPTC
jgi:hypothetical protein